MDVNKIDRLCDFYKINNYRINNDLSIDVDGDVDLQCKGLYRIPLKFNLVSGVFRCYHNNLSTLINSPKECLEFICFGNNLRSLKYAPLKCNKIYCYSNKLKSLKYIPDCDVILANLSNIDLYKEPLRTLEILSKTYINNKTLLEVYEYRLISYNISNII